MTNTESDVTRGESLVAASGPAVKVSRKPAESVLDKLLKVLSSVRFGVTMLSILLICCMIGMIVMQVEIEGFQEYHQRLTPAQRLVYGGLGFFNIYHTWYFSLLLAITGLNIILASIDRFPTAWQYYSKPRAMASPNFVKAQMFNVEERFAEAPAGLSERVSLAWKKLGFRPKVSREGDRITVFGQRNLWNRFGAYVVHVALLTIFIGGFLTNRYGVGGMLEIIPGRESSTFNTFEPSIDGRKVGQAQLPFAVECRDLQQRLIRPEGNLDPNNTIDWLSYVTIKDGDRSIEALVHLNYPFDYRGYRFFQSSFMAVGNARSVTLRFEPVTGGESREVTIPRNGAAEVEGIGRVSYVNFFPDFDITDNGPTTRSGEYRDPVAQLQIVEPEGRSRAAFAFNARLADQYFSQAAAQGQDDAGENLLLVNGHRIILRDFEKVALSHSLAVQYDPGRVPVYIGFTLLIVALCGVFFFAHNRAWAVIESDGEGSRVFFGGNTNRNRPAFEGRFKSLVQSVTGRRNEDE